MLAVVVDAAFDPECAGVSCDLVEHFLHRQRDLYRLARDHGEGEGERLELDVELSRHSRCRDTGTLMRTRFSGQPSRRAISVRTNDGPCEAV